VFQKSYVSGSTTVEIAAEARHAQNSWRFQGNGNQCDDCVLTGSCGLAGKGTYTPTNDHDASNPFTGNKRLQQHNRERLYGKMCPILLLAAGTFQVRKAFEKSGGLTDEKVQKTNSHHL